MRKRADKRSLGRFALAVHDNSLREAFLINKFAINRGRGISILDYGICNDGQLVLDTSNGWGRADFFVKGEGFSCKLEMKYNPVDYKFTYKIGDLNNYASMDAKVLTVVGPYSMMGPNGNPLIIPRPLQIPFGLKWTIFDRNMIHEMLDELPVRQYEEIGNKYGIQLRKPHIKKYLKLRSWDDKSTFVELLDELSKWSN